MANRDQLRFEKSADDTSDDKKPLRLEELFEAIKLRRKFIALFCAVLLLGNLIKHVFYVPIFRAQSVLTMQEQKQNSLGAALGTMGMGMTSGLSDQHDPRKRIIKYLSSTDFFLEVAESLKFQDGYEKLNFVPLSSLSLTNSIFWNQWKSSYFGGKSNARESMLGTDPLLLSIDTLATYIQYLVAIEEIGTESIAISVTSLDPFTSMFITNLVADSFIKKLREKSGHESAEIMKFLKEQLDLVTERLKKSELSYVDFKRKNNVLSDNLENAGLGVRLTSLDKTVEELRIKIEENNRLRAFYEKVIKEGQNRIISSVSGDAGGRMNTLAVVSQIQFKIDTLNQKRVGLSAQGALPSSYQIQEIDKEIDKTIELLKSYQSKTGTFASDQDETMSPSVANARLQAIKTESADAVRKMDIYQKLRQELSSSLGSLPKDTQDLVNLKREVDLQYELYSNLKKKLQEVEVQQVASQQQAELEISEKAQLPNQVPRTGLIKKSIFALIVGLFLSITIVILLETFDTSIKHVRELEDLNLNPLGVIPHFSGTANSHTKDYDNLNHPELLMCRNQPESKEAMAFKYVRAQISAKRNNDGKPIKVIVVTSPDTGDGKSVFAANLAISLAQIEKKTILIDCNLRHPSQFHLFSFQNQIGLTSLLSLKSALADVLTTDVLSNLDAILAGSTPPNPTELISNEKMHILIEHLRSEYHFIVIDAPQASSIVDASILASFADITILTVSYRKTKKEVLNQAVQKIRQIRFQELYTVLNNVWTANEFLENETNPDGTLSSTDNYLSNFTDRREVRAFEKMLSQKKKTS